LFHHVCWFGLIRRFFLSMGWVSIWGSVRSLCKGLIIYTIIYPKPRPQWSISEVWAINRQLNTEIEGLMTNALGVWGAVAVENHSIPSWLPWTIAVGALLAAVVVAVAAGIEECKSDPFSCVPA
jgi:hypothetical protein